MDVAFDAMPDFVSSWTTSLEVAEHFRVSDGDRTKRISVTSWVLLMPDRFSKRHDLLSGPDRPRYGNRRSNIQR
jgi:hypothetical protein